jgi:voltage-gated potassium channel
MKIVKRLKIAIIMLVAVFLYGSLGQFFFLHSKFGVLEIAQRTIVMLGTINESFSAAELGDLNTIFYKAFMLTLVIFGIAVILFSLSTITAFFVEGELKQLLRFRKMSKEIANLKNHFIICGLGDLGHTIASEFQVSRHPFVVIDNDPERIERIEQEGFLHVRGDATEDDILKEAGIDCAKGMAVSLPRDTENLFVTISARQLNPRLRIITKGSDPKTDRKLKLAGADKVVSPAFIGGMRMASELIRPSVVTFMDKMLRDPHETTRIEEVNIGEGCKMEGETIASSKFKQRTGLQVVAIKHIEDTHFSYDPHPDAPLKKGTTLVVIGRIEDVAKARQMAGMS